MVEDVVGTQIVQLVVIYNETGQMTKDVCDMVEAFVSEGHPSTCVLEGGLKSFRKAFPFLVTTRDREKKISNYRFPSIIEHNFLYLGGHRCTYEEVVKTMNIKWILNVADDCENCCMEGCHYKNIKLADKPSQSITPYFQEAFAFIDKARSKKQRILVHCQAGVSRSASFVIGYLMYKRGWNYDISREYVNERRSMIGPNKGFKSQLSAYEQLLSAMREEEEINGIINNLETF
eukprot:CAMPEP_0168532260 /NCGR_PEP_ID=MMETSP0405-20121227/16096_1 /TAXON_ID=498012 /ORGANISM="Trichosphaerium sp, Strain Am-I-7 wt" /LENGTH=232 /DNA_ID=CAMNT_0008557537 /DNA_START=197 /DNA_END=895 /DNA_ORIENTATION=-